MFSLSPNRSKLTQYAISENLFFKNFVSGTPSEPETPMLSMLILLHTMSFAMTFSKGLVHYYYMPQVSKILSTGIASVPSYKFTVQALVFKV